jgi:hypothetical protein
MAFSDLISRPLTAPLEGLDKSIATGVELANNQYRTQIAMEQNQLEREKLQASYLDKANAMLPSLLKSKGKARSILMNQYINYSARGGSPVKVDSLEVALSQPTEDLDAAYQNILNSVGGDRQRAALVFRQKFGEDAPDAATFIEKSAIQEQSLKAAAQRAFTQRIGIKETAVATGKVKRLFDISKETTKTVEDTSKTIGEYNRSLANIQSAIASNDVSRLRQTMGDLAKGLGGLSGVLSDLDMKTQLASSLGLDLRQFEQYIFGQASIPESTKKNLNQRMQDFKNSISKMSSQKLISQIGNRQLDRMQMGAYDTSVLTGKSGKPAGISLGFAAGRLIDRHNKVLQQLKTAKNELNLEEFVKAQSAPMTPEQLYKTIERAAQDGLIIRIPKSAIKQPPTEEEIYGLQSFGAMESEE